MKNEFFETKRLLEIGGRIDLMRTQYKKSNHYDKFNIKKEAVELQKNLNRSIGKLKSKLKKKYYYDDFIVVLIDKVF